MELSFDDLLPDPKLIHRTQGVCLYRAENMWLSFHQIKNGKEAEESLCMDIEEAQQLGIFMSEGFVSEKKIEQKSDVDGHYHQILLFHEGEKVMLKKQSYSPSSECEYNEQHIEFTEEESHQFGLAMQD